MKAVGNGKASKLFIPYEATAILGALGTRQESFVNPPKHDDDDPAERVVTVPGSKPPHSLPPAQ